MRAQDGCGDAPCCDLRLLLLFPALRSGAVGSIKEVAVGATADNDNRKGWHLMACHTAPEFPEATAKDAITLGVLLGAGSFGERVGSPVLCCDAHAQTCLRSRTANAAVWERCRGVLDYLCLCVVSHCSRQGGWVAGHATLSHLALLLLPLPLPLLLLPLSCAGRVYRGRWRGLDVAVKVLHHDVNTAASVANEVDLVMSFRWAQDGLCWCAGSLGR